MRSKLEIAMRRIALSLAAVFMLATAASPALATDLCVDTANLFPFPHTLVAKAFKIPSRHKCNPLHGYLDGLGLVAGTGCMSTDGTLLRLQFTYNHEDFNEIGSGACNFDFPSMTSGNCHMKVISEFDTTVNYGPSAATAARCVQ